MNLNVTYWRQTCQSISLRSNRYPAQRLVIKARFGEERAEREEQRCMACGSTAFIKYLEDCMTCHTCERDCPEKAIFVSSEHVLPGVSSWGSCSEKSETVKGRRYSRSSVFFLFISSISISTCFNFWTRWLNPLYS